MRYIVLRTFFALLLLLLLAAGAAFIGFRIFQNYLVQPLPLTEPVLIEVMPGNSLHQITRRLGESALLDFPQALALWGRYQGVAGSIKTGEYELLPGITPEGLLALLVSGRNKQYPLTIVEGWTFQQALEAIWLSEKITPLLKDADDQAVLEARGGGIPFLEGSIYPDTYFYTAGTTDAAILSRARQRLEAILEEEWSARDSGLPYTDSHQALVMASVVEKESGVQSELSRVAGVFVRRLQRGMRLQSDPTVIYGVGAEYTGVIRRSDLNADNPYNTYRIAGLPPTPISLVGRAAIRAALNPEEGPWLYFVASGDGGHYFSSTLEEHNAAVTRYRRRLAESAASGTEQTHNENSDVTTQGN
jgi:UPF0755 protein